MNFIDEDELDINQQLRDIYHSPAAGYRSIETLYKRAKEKGIEVTRKEVKSFLKSQDTYTKTFPKGGLGLQKKTYRPTVVGKLGQQLQMDLVDMTDQRASSNDGNRYILTAIEVLSRFAFTAYQKRKSGKDTVVSVERVLDKFKKHFKTDPDLVQFHDGSEFLNPEVKELLKDREIHYFSTLVRRTGYHRTTKKNKTGERPWVWGPYTLFQRKASLVERLNRSLKNIMWKYFKENNNHQWIHILNDIAENYNNSVNRSIKMKPNEVVPEKFLKMLTKFGSLCMVRIFLQFLQKQGPENKK